MIVNDLKTLTTDAISLVLISDLFVTNDFPIFMKMGKINVTKTDGMYSILLNDKKV